MEWTEFHGPLLAKAFERVLGRPDRGSMAFARCLTADVVKSLASDSTFAPHGWDVLRVADAYEANIDMRTITADRAVEIREAKKKATLLLIDTGRVGAGIDGIYNASQEVDEGSLFREAQRLAGRQITKLFSVADRENATEAIKKARGSGRACIVSPWAEFDFLCRVMASRGSLGAHVHLLGLWNFLDSPESDQIDTLLSSACIFVDRLLGTTGASLAPAARVETLRLDKESEREKGDLERFLNSVDTKPLLTALETLADKCHLWIGALRTRSAATSIQRLKLISWRNRNGTIAKWSGLTEEANENDSEEAKPPVLILGRDADQRGALEVRWKPDPADLEKGATEYRVSVWTDVDEELAVSENILHSARKAGERCRFTKDDFSSLPEDALLSAKVVVELADNHGIERQVSEEFVIRFGDPPDPEVVGFRETVRTFSDGLADMEHRNTVSMIATKSPASEDARGFVLLRTVEEDRRKSFRVFRPSLIAEAERQWIQRQGSIGRWTVAVRGSGRRAGPMKFEPFKGDDRPQWERAEIASRRMVMRFDGGGGGVGQLYDDEAGSFPVVQEYLRAWAALLEAGDPLLAIANTVEVQSLAGRTIGLIVLPAHPLRVAWHVAYDNLVLHTAFEEKKNAKEIGTEFASLDGAMFPPFLPNPRGGAFVFADTLGFHAVGMVPDTDKEPKAAVAILSHALGDGVSEDSAPTVGGRSARVLANELIKYLECHKTDDLEGNTVHASPLLQIHALRAGDGFTIARSLGAVHDHYRRLAGENRVENPGEVDGSIVDAPLFSLELYPSYEQRGIAGRFIADAREKRRSGAGVLASEDRWMLKSLSLPGDVRMPCLRWARKEPSESEVHAYPKTAAHLAIAFDTFESRVDSGVNGVLKSGPYHAFGLLSYYQRHYTSVPSPLWDSVPLPATEGEKHPSRRTHTETLTRLQDLILRTVSCHLNIGSVRPVLRTDITPEKAIELKNLHRLCDWVVTLDRNVGIEYFDSPRDNQDIYDAYVIDCVPEREDLGCLQLITSTTNLEEVRNLLHRALGQMGLSHSRQNAEFLLEHLKALSGRLAIRLTGHRPATSELIALAMSHANCQRASVGDKCWVSLEDGFIIPVDDVRDILPPWTESSQQGEKERRPDLIYVTTVSRKGLVFRFIEVKYRRHLLDARAPSVLTDIEQQTQSLRRQWYRYYGHGCECDAFRAVRRAKLARVLRFYADKAYRHNLPTKRHGTIVSEIDRMIERGASYVFPEVEVGDLGWVFSPEYVGNSPLKISPDAWDTTHVYLFGPSPSPTSKSRDGVTATATLPTANSLAPLSAADRESSATDSVLAVQRKMKDVDEGPSRKKVGASDYELGYVASDISSVSLGVETLGGTTIDWSLTVKGNPHLLVAGLPGMGKTTCLLSLCKQMVGIGIQPLVFSYHQDIDNQLEQFVGPVRFVDFDGLGFNPLSIINLESQTAYLDVAGSLRDIFSAIFPELGDLQCESIRAAIKESFVEAGWSMSGPGAQEPEFKRFVEILRSNPNPDRGLRTLLVRLAELEDYGFFNIGTSQESLWESDRPIVIRIHSTQNETLQRAFASLVFYGLYKDMFRRGIQDRITHALIFDEAHRAAGLKLIPTMAKECRKYGVSLVLASQEARDFNVSLFSAIANYLVLRLTEADAKALVRNVSTARQERTLIDRIKQMARFKALYFSEGKQRPSAVDLLPLDV